MKVHHEVELSPSVVVQAFLGITCWVALGACLAGGLSVPSTLALFAGYAWLMIANRRRSKIRRVQGG